jgi:hypothetical protein
MISESWVRTRYKTGDRCASSGWYRFDGYRDGTTVPLPRVEELNVYLEADELFPPIRSSRQACWWQTSERLG